MDPFYDSNADNLMAIFDFPQPYEYMPQRMFDSFDIYFNHDDKIGTPPNIAHHCHSNDLTAITSPTKSIDDTAFNTLCVKSEVDEVKQENPRCAAKKKLKGEKKKKKSIGAVGGSMQGISIKEENKDEAKQGEKKKIFKVIRTKRKINDEKKKPRVERVEEAYEKVLPILEITKKYEMTLEWCYNNNIIPRFRSCHKCSKMMKVVKYSASILDRRCFRCESNSCRRLMRFRSGTFFQYSKLTLMELIRIIFYYFLLGFNVIVAAQDLREYTNIDHKSVREVYRNMRNKIHEDLWKEYNKKLTKKKEYEIDEIVFCDTEVNSNELRAFWILGIFEKESKNSRIFYVPDWDKEKIVVLIREHVEDGAVIYTGEDIIDDYQSLKMYYKHKTIVKKNESQFGFKERTTDKIEFFRAHLQRILFSSPMHKDYQVQASIDEAVWRRKYKTIEARQEKLIDYIKYKGL